jgi:hypothetical protein
MPTPWWHYLVSWLVGVMFGRCSRRYPASFMRGELFLVREVFLRLSCVRTTGRAYGECWKDDRKAWRGFVEQGSPARFASDASCLSGGCNVL